MSRDGVPLCPRHADATTPPLGWTMNDLRSQNRTLTPVPNPSGPRTGEVVSPSPPPTPTSTKPTNPLFTSSRPTEPRRRRSESDGHDHHDQPAEATGDDTTEATQGELTFQVSRQLRSMPVTAESPEPAPAERPARSAADGSGARTSTSTAGEEGDAPQSRPSKRRDVEDEADEPEERFPWHHQFSEDDEPLELKAESPLLSRAFRYSVG